MVLQTIKTMFQDGSMQPEGKVTGWVQDSISEQLANVEISA